MRILAIRGEKLASLADRFEIDFEREPLRGAGLFAITGETGAGKSTILDALCLALYDNFPRVGSQGGDASALDSSGQPISASDPRSILRRGASRGFAEVDFLARNGIRYRARCELMRARGKATGNLQPRARSLHEIDDAGTLVAPIASGVEPVREKIAELTDLTFEQFRRTVLLAQGDFDAFLRADSKERAELLEKITGASIYAIISKNVFQRTKEAENSVATLRQRLADIRLLDAEIRTALSSQIQDAEDKRARTQQARETALIELRRHETIAAAQTRAAHATAEQDAALAAMDSLAELQARLSLLEKAEPLRALAQQQEKSERALRDARAAQESAQSNESAAQKSELDLHEQEHIAAATLERADSQLQYFAPLWSQAESLDSRIDVAAKESASAQENVLAAQKSLDEKQQAHAKLALELQQLRSDLQEARNLMERLSSARPLHEQWPDIEDWLEKRSGFAFQCANNRVHLSQLAQDIERSDALLAAIDAADAKDRAERDQLAANIEEREHVLTALDEATAQARARKLETISQLVAELSIAASRHQEATRSYSRATADLDAASRAEHTETTSIASLRQLRALEEARREETERLGELADATSSNEALKLRASLIDGEPCPVCGATDHPHRHSTDAAQILVDELRARRDELRDSIARADRELAQASERLSAARAQAEDARRRIESSETEQANATGDYARCLASWPDDERATFPSIERAEEALKRRATEIREERAALSCKLDQAQALRADGDALRQAHDAHARAIDERHSERETTAGARSVAAMEATRLDAETKGLNERIVSIDRSLAPFLALSNLAASDLDRDPAGAKARLALKGEEFCKAATRVAELEKALAELTPRDASAEAEAREAAKAEQSGKETATHRATELKSLREERAALLGGEATQAHRERVNALARDARANLDEITTKRAQSSIALASARERARAAKAEASHAEEACDAACSSWRSALAQAGLDEVTRLALFATSAEECAAMRAKIDAAEQRAVLAKAAAAGRQRDLEEALREGRPEQDRDHLEASVTRLSEELSSLGESLGAVKERIAADDMARERAGELSVEIDESMRAHRTWAEINAAIGSASGDKFRRFAQGVTLEHLIALANRHLAALSPRYALERVMGDGGDLGLQIIDRDMADERRSTRSLSGGERFLASLALALALSSLEGRDSFVDTLFIDEGFGTLDAVTLDVAIDALETLPGQGRKVGVISHVESLHQRIATQIRVEKRGGGASVVRLRSPLN